MFANSLLILFSSSSRARALRKSAMKDTSPRMVGTSPEVLLLLLNSPPLPAAAIFADTDIVEIVRGLQPPRVCPDKPEGAWCCVEVDYWGTGCGSK